MASQDLAPKCKRSRLCQRTYNGGTLRKFYPVAVGIEDHRDPRRCSECGWSQTLASTSRKNLGMDLVNFENLKGDVAPARSLTTGIQMSVRPLLHDDQGLASPKC